MNSRPVDRLNPKALEILDGFTTSNTELRPALGRVALYCMHAGIGYVEYAALAEASQLCSGHKRQREVLGAIEKSWEYADNKFDPLFAGPDALRRRLYKLRDEIQYSNLPAGVRETAKALVTIGIGCGERGAWTVDASARRVMEITGASLGPTADHLNQLKDYGIVTEVSYSGVWRTSRRFTLDIHWEGGGLTEHIKYMHISYVYGYSPLWSKHGLGPTAWRVWASVPDVYGLKSEIVKASGCDKRTVSRHLDTLVALNLVSARRGRYCLNPLVDLEAAAADAYASIDAMKAKHKADRVYQDVEVEYIDPMEGLGASRDYSGFADPFKAALADTPPF